MKPPKETRRVEGRGGPEGVQLEFAQIRTQSRRIWPAKLGLVAAAAGRDKNTRMTALLHHVDEAALWRAFRRIKRSAAPGVDGVTVESYERALRANLRDLHTRLHTGIYRPQPVRRVYIAKADGGQRPLGVPALADKIVQGAVAEVLSAIYEGDFVDFSYGFRPGRNPHQALVALRAGLMQEQINWVLDADIRSFFDSVDHRWLLRMLAHRIADRRMLRLIALWLRAGVMEDRQWHESKRGTPQGAGISPLLANIFLHYVFDLWVRKWSRTARGLVVVVRYADDFVMGFEQEQDARRMLVELKERLLKFGLQLHPDKTRLIEFGRRAAQRRAWRGERRCETFNFLGLTHYMACRRRGGFVVRRKTQRQRLTRKLDEMRAQMWQWMHEAVAVQQRRINRVLEGHYEYYGLSGNYRGLNSFFHQVRRHWHRVLKRRSQRGLNWPDFEQVLRRFPLRLPRIVHPLEVSLC